MEISEKLSKVLADLKVRKCLKHDIHPVILRETSDITEEEHIYYPKLMVSSVRKTQFISKELLKIGIKTEWELTIF